VEGRDDGGDEGGDGTGAGFGDDDEAGELPLVYSAAGRRVRVVNLRQEPGLVIGHRHLQTLQGTATLVIFCTTGVSHAVDGDCTFQRTEAACCVRVVGQDQHSNDGYKDSDCGFDDEQPSPGAKTMYAIKTVLDASSDETTETTGQKRTSIEDGCSESKFFTSVPGGQEEEGTWEVWAKLNVSEALGEVSYWNLRLDDTKEETNDH
jgi:hypothetical protein